MKASGVGQKLDMVKSIWTAVLSFVTCWLTLELGLGRTHETNSHPHRLQFQRQWTVNQFQHGVGMSGTSFPQSCCFSNRTYSQPFYVVLPTKQFDLETNKRQWLFRQGFQWDLALHLLLAIKAWAKEMFLSLRWKGCGDR